MKEPTNLENLHIGNMIKEIAQRKNVSSKKIADVIPRDKNNFDKIYHVNDIDCNAMVKVSYLLSYNFLKVISEKYLSHIPVIEYNPDEKKYQMVFDTQTGHYDIIGDLRDNKILNNIKTGLHLKAFAQKNGWHEQEMAKLLHCSQSTVSELYAQNSLKVKKLLQISDALKHNFIAEVYLDRMFILSSPDKISRATVTEISQEGRIKEIRIENPDDNNFLMVFHR